VATLEKSRSGHSAAEQAFDLYFLAMGHARLGDRAKAQDCLDQAKALHQRNAASLEKEQTEELQRFRVEQGPSCFVETRNSLGQAFP
jgi:hypothetical protein